MTFDSPKIVSEPALVDRLLAENLALRERVRVLSTMSFEDPLTGLKNRRFLDDQLQLDCARAARQERPFSVLVIDIDDFKQANDQFGHAAGDMALVWVARFLEGAVRDGDVICRTGGDEFTVLLPDTDAHGAAALIERIEVRRQRALGCKAINTTPRLSMGVASWRGPKDDAQQLLDRADHAMYHVKRARPRRHVGRRRSA